MNQYPFIFSNQLKFRLARHTLFWFCWWVFCSFLYSFTPVLPGGLPYSTRIAISATEAAIFLGIHAFVAYSLVYFVVPHLIIKGRYFFGFIAVVSVFIVTGVLNGLLSPYVGQLR